MRVKSVINNQVGGCVFYRQLSPHLALKNIKFEAVNTTQDKELDCDIIQYHKGFITPSEVARAKREGVHTIVDFDDYWHISTSHDLYRDYYKKGIDLNGTWVSVPDFYKSLLEFFDTVTCTTEALADKIRPFNPNVYVLPNSIDTSLPQYTVEDIPDDKVRIGWIGGSFHLQDISLLQGVNNTLYSTHKDKYKLILFGYTPGTVYDKYLQIMSSGKPVYTVPYATYDKYTQFYNYTDIALAPLKDDLFNSLKSELKMIEAGFFKKALIVSNVAPYKRLIQHGENCLAVNKPGDWVRWMKYLIENPDERKRLGENLYKTVQEFDLNVTNKKRLQLYSKCIIKQQSSVTEAI